MQRESLSITIRDETREQAGREKRERMGSEKNATASVESQRRRCRAIAHTVCTV